MSNKLLVRDCRSGKTYDIQIKNGAVSAAAFSKITTKQMGSSNGLKILDPGFRNTAVKQSCITFLDAHNSTILLRDLPIEKLFEKFDYEEVAYLLIWGHLPNSREKEEFRSSIASSMVPPREVEDVIMSFSPTAPAFTILIAALSAWSGAFPSEIPLSAGDPFIYSPKNMAAIDRGSVRLIAASTAIVAMIACYKRQMPFASADPKATLPYNMLLMAGIVDLDTGKPRPSHVEVLNKLMVIYSDHEMTNSTAAFLHVGSSLADPFACAIAGYAAAYGPLHAGAMELAYKQYAAIGSPEKVPDFLQRVKAKETRIFGFGHRVWKTTDPRCKLVNKLFNEDGIREVIAKNELLRIAMEIDRLASQDQELLHLGVRPNVDLVGCFGFSALGFEQELVIACAGNARIAGCLAHWHEQLRQPIAIWRPQAIYTPERNAGASPYMSKL